MSDKTKDNITDFSKYVDKMRLERSEEQSKHLKGYLLSLKQEMDTSDLARRALKTAVSSIMRAIIFLQISHYAEGSLRECGMNPDDFLIDTQSYLRFMSSNDLVKPDVIWNGPWYVSADDNYVYKAVTWVCVHELDMEILFKVLRIRDEDEKWQAYREGDWIEGPEWDYFDNLWESEDECCKETDNDPIQ